MSFWPFGQNVNSSNINKLLDDYFSVLHQVESITATNPQSLSISRNSSNADKSIAAKRKQHNDDDDDDDDDDNDEPEIEEAEEGLENDDDNNEHILVSPQDINFVSNGISINGSNTMSNKSNNSGKEAKSTSSNDQQNNFEIFQNLNSSFIDQILEESELLNELTRKNNTLLDFICFGYFYDSDLNKILNLEYLINLLMFSINGVNNKRNATASTDNDNFTDESPPTASSPMDISNGKTRKKCDKNNDNDNDNINDNDDDDNDDDDDDGNNEYQDKHNKDTEEERFLQKATIISEVFALDIWLISESLVKNPIYLSNIWSILANPNFNSPKSPLVPIFLKINTNLLVTRQDQYLNFIRTLSSNGSTEHQEPSPPTPNSGNTSPASFQHHLLVDDMLQHVDCPVLMDFFLKIISTDKIDNPTGVLELVYEQGLIKKLMKFFQNDIYPTDLQSSSCDFLKALIAISANAPLDDLTIGPNILTRQLCTDPEILDLFIRIITKEKGYALNMAVSIVIELIRKNNSDYDQVNLLTTTIKLNPPSQRDPIYLGYMLKIFAENLSDIVEILNSNQSLVEKPLKEDKNDADNSTAKAVYINQMGEVYKPLGFEKFKVVELIAELLHCSNMGLMNSRKAEYMATKRNSLRYNLSKQLEDALKDLNLGADGESDEDFATETHTSISASLSATVTAPSSPSSEVASSFDSSKPISPQMSTSHDDIQNSQSNQQQLDDLQQYDFYDQEEEDIMKIEEIEEIFDIPYVNANQNAKLRDRPTIGDYFKIQLFDLQILPRIVKMFLQYPWNNFWHNVIFDILQQVFNGRMDYSYNSFLVYALFANNQIGQYAASSSEQINGEASAVETTSQLSNKPVVLDFDLPRDLILNGYEASGEFYQKHNINLGYMGHLVLIAEEIVKFSKVYKVDLISEDIHESLTNPKWIYYADDILMDTRLMYSKILGGDMIATNGSSEEDLLIEQRLQEQQQQAHQAAAAAAAAAKHNENGDLLRASGSDSENDLGTDEVSSNSLLSEKGEEEFIHYTTQDDLHKKLKEKLIEKSEEEVKKRNMDNGVIVLGYAPTETTDTEMPEEQL
ncbi:hypothetical protein ACO0QE_000895 [Hanseniaspora vineae]